MDNEEATEENRATIISLLEKSVRYAQEAANIDPSNFRYRIEEGNSLAMKSFLTGDVDFEEALAAYRQAQQRAPFHPLPHLLIGSIFVKKGDVESARISLGEALKIKPDYREALQLMEQVRTR
jgi:tetratricopeptide (TPR) repeat protein